jgi:hypothetical protein
MTATRRLAAILAADVAGYSRLMGADEEGTLERLKALRRELQMRRMDPGGFPQAAVVGARTIIGKDLRSHCTRVDQRSVGLRQKHGRKPAGCAR